MATHPTLDELKAKNPNIDPRAVEDALRIHSDAGGNSAKTYRLSVPYSQRQRPPDASDDSKPRYIKDPK